MNEILAKISTYDIFNNLVPGAVVAYLLAVLDVYKIDAGSLVTDLVVFYFIGLVVSRIGSLVLEPLLKFASGLIETKESGLGFLFGMRCATIPHAYRDHI
ncbi:hypothetical protein F4V91_08125 [Neorhizobium galegae]|uniref:Uncharacterized protein n=1 Tax=Neorhizobium galegae TaxID=399 RepID=A0A6A1TNI0_NEOGA|nr:hypothetical protein [Neorhizobium galegae]KAB1086401.1 hypothetical protein F4V91_08125 [Neorhizobium galegae]